MPTIKLYAGLRKKAGQTEVSITGASLRTSVSALVEQIPALEGVIVQDGQIRPHFVININGHAATGLEVDIQEDDVIAIFPPIAGG
ncbi:MAG: hypothetical protein HN413_01180 [Chloroflexi bacterium]|jgi:sulfur-carrier protein|nr:hypothetical protein [Chloroflexota bacterium]